MSAFSVAESSLAELPAKISQLQKQFQTLPKAAPQSAATPAPVAHFKQLQPFFTEYLQLKSRVEEITLTLTKASARAAEKDPNRQIYGPSMLKRVQATTQTFTPIQASWQQLSSQIDAFHKQTSSASESAIAQSAAADKKRAADAEAAAIAQQKAAFDAEQKAKADAAKARDERIKAQAEQDAKFQAEALAKKADLIEKKKSELREKRRDEEKRKAQIDADKAAKLAEKLAKKEKVQQSIAAQAESTASAAAAKPQSTDSTPLGQHLAQLKAACGSVHADYIAAIQILLRFVVQIMNNPHNPAHLVINLQNTIFKQKVADKAGGIDACKDIGFKPLADDANTLKMQVSADQWLVLVSSKAALEQQLKEAQAAQASAATSAAPAAAPQAATPAPASAATTAAAAAPSTDVEMSDADADEDALLQQAIAMSMQQQQPPSSPSKDAKK